VSSVIEPFQCSAWAFRIRNGQTFVVQKHDCLVDVANFESILTIGCLDVFNIVFMNKIRVATRIQQPFGRLLDLNALEECLQSMDSSDDDSSSGDSSALSSWTDDSSYSFDVAELADDLSHVLTASKRLKVQDSESSPSDLKENGHRDFHKKHDNSTDTGAKYSIPRRFSFNSLTSGDFQADDERTIASIREDLLKIGCAVLTSRKGDAFRERAVVLASINYLARNVPCCVLDHLGREVRQAESRSLFQDQSTPSTASYSSSSMSSGSSDDWDESCYLLEESKSHCRSLTRIQSLGSREGLILDLPYVAPFQGVALFGKLRSCQCFNSRSV
jgi:hypothetical protein